MIAILPLILVPALPSLSNVAPAPPTTVVDDFEDRMKAAGEDVEKLWEVRLWLVDEGRDEEARKVVEKILEIDPEHEASHRALSHHNYDGKWFESYSALSKYRREEEKRMREEHGKVRFGDGWALEADIPYLRMGWIKQDDGTWADGRVIKEREAEAKMIAEGYQLRPEDSTWIHPDDFGKWTEGLWKCGEEWLSFEDAEKYHSELNQWWKYAGEHFFTYSTCDFKSVEWAKWWADQTYGDLVKIFGLKPEEKPVVLVLNGVDQYNEFATNTETSGHSSVHYAFYAETWFEGDPTAPRYMAAGAGWWDKNDAGFAPYGQHSVRHAAAHSFIEAIDPSWNALSALMASGGQGGASFDAFWAEKKIPRWLRYGAANYVERFFIDTSVGEGGDPGWPKAWALANLRDKGGLRTVERVFEFTLDPNDVPGSAQLINEAGLLVAFMLDGECKPVIDAHQKLKAVLREGGDTKEAIEELEKALTKNEKKIRKFAD